MASETEARATAGISRPWADAPPTGPLWWIASGSIAAAGGLHAAAAFALDEGYLATLFFVLTAIAQLAAGAWVGMRVIAGRAPPAWTAALALAASVGLIWLYLIVHGTTLLSAVVASHHSEGLLPTADVHSLLGMGTVAVELVTVVSTAAVLPVRWRRPASDGLLALATLAWGLWLAGVLA